MSTVLRDTTTEIGTLVGRSLRRSTRELDTLLLSLMLPVLLMLMFVGIFGGAISTRDAYVDYVVPGVILICGSYGAAQTAVGVAADQAEGIVTRLRTMPIAASAVLAGHVVASLARNAVATVAVVGVALLLGFDPEAGPGAWGAASALLLLWVLGITWLSVAIGLMSPSAEAASGFTFGVLFLPYVSSAFVRTDTLPSWLQGFAEHQPVTPVIETLRGLLLGGSGTPWEAAVAWALGACVVGWLGSVVLFRRRT